MDKYLKMADVFKGELFIDCDNEEVIVDDLSLTVLESFSGVDAAKFALHAINSHDELVAEVELLRSVCAEAYQMAGALDAPVEVLDNLLAAANGEDLPHETFLPVASHDLIAEIERLRDALQDAYLDGCHYGWGMSAEGYNAEHGGPNDGRLHNQFIESYSGEPYISE